MELDVLSGRHMADPCGVLLGQLGDPAQLIAGQPPEGDFDPDHLDAGLPLPVNAVLETEGFKEIAGQVSRQNPLHLDFECFNLFENILGDGGRLHRHPLDSGCGHRRPSRRRWNQRVHPRSSTDRD
jgi:hypothetical protein